MLGKRSPILRSSLNKASIAVYVFLGTHHYFFYGDVSAHRDNLESYLLDTCILVDFLRGNKSIYDIALIAATSLVTKLELMTYNKADFQYIPNIKLYKF